MVFRIWSVNQIWILEWMHTSETSQQANTFEKQCCSLTKEEPILDSSISNPHNFSIILLGLATSSLSAAKVEIT